MRQLSNHSGWRKILAAIAIFNFVGLQVMTPVFGVTVTSINVMAAKTTPVLLGFSLSASTVVFGATAPTIVAPTSQSAGAITYTSATTGTATISTAGVISLAGVGTTTFTATQAADGNYAQSTTTTVLTVTVQTASLSSLVLSSSTVIFGAAAPTITGVPSSVSSGAITYTSSNTAVASINVSTGVISLAGVGTTTLTATQAANGNYASNTTTTTLTVTATTSALSGFSLNTPSVAYGTSTMPTIIAPSSASSGAISYAVTGSTSTTPAVISSTGIISAIGSVGTTTFTATQAANGNYAQSTTTTILTVTAITITSSVITGVTAPVSNAIPVTTITAVAQYTGTVTWSSSPTRFGYDDAYTATITLTPAVGYTFTGVTANFFKVSGATAINSANSGTITALFPATLLPVGYIKTMSVSGSTLSGSGTLVWSTVTGPTVNWSTASTQCSAIGTGWRMASQVELSALSSTSAALSAGTAAGWTLSRTWSSTPNGSNYNNVYLNTSVVVSLSTGNSSYMSCVY